jgi:hypothetical protein
MNEVFPVLAGIAIGLATHAVRPIWFKALLIGSLGIALGAAASWLSGELAVTWVYVFFDAAEVVAVGIMTGILVKVWLRRTDRASRASW